MNKKKTSKLNHQSITHSNSDYPPQPKEDTSAYKAPLGERLFVGIGSIVVCLLLVGYAHLGYLAFHYSSTPSTSDELLGESVTTSPIVEEELKPNLEPQPTSPKELYAIINYDGLNVRTEKSSDSPRLGQLWMGDEVPVLEVYEEESWIKIQFEGVDAYIHADYVTLEERVVESISSQE